MNPGLLGWLASLSNLLGLAEGEVRGPSPSFNRAHVLFVFLTVGEAGSIGRQALARRVGLGEGAIRTVLGRLREEGYADAGTSGCFLTPTGVRTYESIRRRASSFLPLVSSRLTIGRFQTALVVRGRGHLVGNGIEQRDSAIRLGALGATTYVVKSGKFTIPGGSSDCERDFPAPEWRNLRRDLDPRNGDAVILCGARTESVATVGALGATLTLL